ncbi:MAG TPA: molybdopterin-binding protein, partial [Streptosporangiaceae bacterium]|nr:molybdopterin-binding protein [Streptosporangiaceae bacterium]
MSAPRAADTEPGPSPQAAYARWMDACTTAGWRAEPGAEPVPVRDGLGRVIAVPVRARWPAPRSDCAAMDGIAFSADAAAGAADAEAGPADAEAGRADAEAGRAGPAGQWRLAASAFTWVDTGDPMPAGLDTVVERERVRLDADGSAEITGAAPRGLHVRARGEDFGAGELLVPAGHLLRPADLAAAATAGHVTLQVARRPVAAIIPTGDEIAPIGATLRPGDVVDSNSLMLASRASQVGARPLISDVQPDDPDAIAAEVRRTALTADIVLIIAGSSAGRSDYAAAVLAQVGGLAVRGVAVRPGHPVLLGYASRNPVQASRNPVQASRSPIQADRSPIQADRNPVQADRNPVQA